MNCHIKFQLILALILIVPASGLRLVSTLNSKECSKKYAVCVVGAVRSMVYNDVMTSFTHDIVDPIDGCGNFFFHLLVAQEASDRGQQSMNKSHAESMVKALRHATQFSLQYEENAFTCGQQTTGRYPKIAACASMVRKYESENHVVHDIFILTRPDVKYTAPFPVNMFTNAQPEHPIWFMQYVDGDLYVSSGGTAISVLEQTHTANCCDTKKREPKECFIRGLKEPRANFIFYQYLSEHLSELPPIGHFGNHLVRTEEMFHGGKTNTLSEHGKYRLEVAQVEHPRTVESLGWKSMDKNQQIAWMEQMLNV